MKRLFAACPLALLAGCFLPVSTAAPQSASTVGAGSAGVTMYGEFPTLDLLGTETQATSEVDYAIAPLPTMTLAAAYGLGERLDVEVGLDGVMYIVLPLPLGGSIGLRYQAVDSPGLALALFGRAGYVGLGVSDAEENDPNSTHSVTATYGQAGVVAQARALGPFRPGLALAIMPARVHNEIKSETAENFGAVAASATVNLTFAIGWFEATPFVNFVAFDSPNLKGRHAFATFGTAFSIRPQKAPRPPVAEAAPPAGPVAPVAPYLR